MHETPKEKIDELWQKQKDFFASHRTQSIEFRLDNLKRLKSAILKNEKKITDAVWADLHKSYEEAFLTEISILLQELDKHIKNLKRWARPKKVGTPLFMRPSTSKVFYEPLGVSLIISPWNYPFQLLMNPLIGSISAGNCAILKPSPFSKHTALLMEEIIKENFPPEYVALVQGSKPTNEILLKKRFDVIFFTGSPAVGKVVMKAAAEHLTPVILELGGKSPCIVDHNANIEVAARRIAWGKALNSGQTCIAPDYLLVHSSVKDELIRQIGLSWDDMFGNDKQQSRFYPRMIHREAFDRVKGYLNNGTIQYGGETHEDERYISPTIIDGLKPDDPIMQEEIFGPVLPVFSFNETDEAIYFINGREKPLALYYFGKNRQAWDVLRKTSSGGTCINDTIMHVANGALPFGGVGNSGMGRYHGKDSFLAFSNQRSVITTPTWIDLPVKYVPFKFFGLIKKY